MTSDDEDSSSNNIPKLCQSLSPFGEVDDRGQRLYYERLDTLN